MSSYHNEEELKELEESLKNAKLIRFTVCDIHGIARTKLIPSHALAHALRQGTAVPECLLVFGPTSQIPAVSRFQDTGFNNSIMVAQVGTSCPISWTSAGVRNNIYHVLCEMYLEKLGKPQAFGPRSMARRQVDILENEFGWRVKTGYECEFTMLTGEDRLDASSPPCPVFTGTPYVCEVVTSRFEETFADINKFLLASGIQPECFEIEYGAGQFEIPLIPSWGVKAADDVFVLKHAIKEYCEASSRGLLATFMSKPSEELSGTGTHLNHSLWDAVGNNVFHSPTGKFGLSKTAWHWLGGLVHHLPALTAICNPTVNCYQRVGSSVFSPKLGNWAVDNRMTSIRVKNSSPASTYMENRVPSGISNPYLTLAATLAAGIDGVRRRLEPPTELDKEAAVLPSSLSESLKALEEDVIMVEALGREFVEIFTANKREHEVKKLEVDGVGYDKHREEYMLMM